MIKKNIVFIIFIFSFGCSSKSQTDEYKSEARQIYGAYLTDLPKEHNEDEMLEAIVGVLRTTMRLAATSFDFQKGTSEDLAETSQAFKKLWRRRTALKTIEDPTNKCNVTQIMLNLIGKKNY